MNKWLKITLSFAFLCLIFGFSNKDVKAVEKDNVSTDSAILQVLEATPAAVVVEQTEDLTVPTKEKGRLEMIMDEQQISGVIIFDFLKLAFKKAVGAGVSPNTLVVLFLFPLVAALVAFSRQILGVSGFGIITPALLSVAFLSTGGLAGVILLSFILLVAIISRVLMRKVKIPFLPKLAMSIWVVSVSVVGLLVLSPIINLDRLIGVGIFPILLFVLLAETFIEAQITRTLKTALLMTLETVILALVAYKVMSAWWVQTQVILHPELVVILILLVDYVIGKYEGLRLLEVWRFRKMLKK